MKADIGPDRDTTMIDGLRCELPANLARGAVVTVATHSSHEEDDRLRHLKVFAPSYAAPAAGACRIERIVQRNHARELCLTS